MFQPQPTPYATFYGMGSGLPGYTFNQHQQSHLIPGAYLGGEQGAGDQGLEPIGGGGGGLGGSYGPESGLPVAAGAGGIGAFGAGATGVSAAASGPAGATSLLFTSAAFNNTQHHHNNNGAEPEPGAFRSSFNPINRHPHQRHPAIVQRSNHRHHHHRRTHPNIKMEPDLNPDLAAQEAAARDYRPHLEVRH